ncbi:MAG: hypothetical protein LUQ47_00045 [Methanotrichaceae archaeon]|nr:hypothetical protein [Methanotrichaceae archaeon]
MARIQTDRGHKVCDSGPYRIVRHPGYAGNILPLPGIVLALGSIILAFHTKPYTPFREILSSYRGVSLEGGNRVYFF